MPVPAAEWQPAEGDVDALGERSRTWLAATTNLYQFDAVEGQRLMAALRTLTRIEALETAIAAEGVSTVEREPHALLPALAREQRIFLSQWAALRLERA